MINPILKQVQAITDSVDDGVCTEAQALAKLRVLMLRDARQVQREANKSDLPLGSRMGVAKKGTSHPMRMM